MPKVNLYTSRQNAPASAGGAFINPGGFRYSNASSQALESVGGVLSQLGKKMQQAKANEEEANGIAQYNQLINGFEQEKAALDPDDYQKAFEKRLAGVSKIYEGKSPVAVAALKNKFTVWNEAARADVMRSSIRDNSAKMKANLPDQLVTFAQNNQDDEAMELIEGYNGSVLHDWEVKAWKDKYGEIKQKVLIEQAKDGLDSQMTNIATETGSWDKALEWLNKPETAKMLEEYGLGADDRDKIFDDVKTQAGYQKAKDKQILENTIKAESGELVKRFRTNNLEDLDGIEDFIKSSHLPATGENSKESWYKKYDDKIKAINNGDNDPLTVTEPAVKSPLLVRANTEPGSVSETELAELVGNGITADDMTDILNLQNKRLKEMPTSNNTLAKKWTKSIEDLYTNEFFGAKDAVGTQIKRNKVLTEMSKWLEENPDATNTQAEEFFKEVTDVNGENWFMQIFRPTTGFITSTVANRFAPGVTFWKKDETRKPPADFPDAVWDDSENAWTVIRDGQLYKVNE